MNRPDHYHIGTSSFVKEKIEPAKTSDSVLTRALLPGQNPVDRSL
jgi:hypothetical protein